jgi:hypothetical protein
LNVLISGAQGAQKVLVAHIAGSAEVGNVVVVLKIPAHGGVGLHAGKELFVGRPIVGVGFFQADGLWLLGIWSRGLHGIGCPRINGCQRSARKCAALFCCCGYLVAHWVDGERLYIGHVANISGGLVRGGASGAVRANLDYAALWCGQC